MSCDTRGTSLCSTFLTPYCCTQQCVGEKVEECQFHRPKGMMEQWQDVTVHSSLGGVKAPPTSSAVVYLKGS
jgi:hypothetical protein